MSMLLKQCFLSKIYGSLLKYNQMFHLSVEKAYVPYRFISLAYKNKSLEGASLSGSKSDMYCAEGYEKKKAGIKWIWQFW